MAKKSRKKKLIWGGAVAIIIIVLVVVNMNRSESDGTMVQADLAYLDEISEIVTASGRIQPQTKVDITSEVPAEIIKLRVAEGDRVVRGQKLLLLDTVQYNSDVDQARFSLDEINARCQASKAQYSRDELDFDRISRLYQQKLISETEFTNAEFLRENSKANYEAMLAQAKTGQARLEKTQDNLSKTSITAPMEGVITYLSVEVGEIAQAQTSFTQGKTLMTIADLSVFEVEVDIDETEIAKVRIGQSAKIRVDAFRDTSFSGTVVEIGNSARVSGQGSDSYSTNFLVKIRFDEIDPGIRPGMSATVDVTTAKEDEALLIPYASVVTREFDPDSLNTSGEDESAENLGDDDLHAAPMDDSAGDSGEEETPANNKFKRKKKEKKTGVFVIKNGTAEFAEITTGIADDRNISVLTGVNPGDTIVSGSFQTLRKLAKGDAVEIDEHSLEKMEENGE
ncbi:MAG: efflux RND transporter periplasmic adaptor subunit [FCB group bacterium]|nr:efflux RND transporter periplasmic adaptor subunit [FCB group bacterium]